eukprot:5429475-Pleurochrysis_carterae.AAC.2
MKSALQQLSPISQSTPVIRAYLPQKPISAALSRQTLELSEKRQLRALIINCILSTDMAHHHDMVSRPYRRVFTKGLQRFKSERGGHRSCASRRQGTTYLRSALARICAPCSFSRSRNVRGPPPPLWLYACYLRTASQVHELTELAAQERCDDGEALLEAILHLADLANCVVEWEISKK